MLMTMTITTIIRAMGNDGGQTVSSISVEWLGFSAKWL